MLLLPALLATAAAPAVLSIAGWLPIVAALAFIAGVAGAAAQLALFDALMRRMPKEHGVTFSSVDQSIQNFAFVLAPNAGGFLAVAFGARTALLVVAVIGFVAFAALRGRCAAKRYRTSGLRTMSAARQRWRICDRAVTARPGLAMERRWSSRPLCYSPCSGLVGTQPRQTRCW